MQFCDTDLTLLLDRVPELFPDHRRKFEWQTSFMKIELVSGELG